MHITLAGHRCEYVEDIITLPCLAGTDVNRQPGTICVQHQGDRLVDPEWGEAYEVTDGGELRGWGTLDGPSYQLTRRDAAWHVNVPKDLLDALMRHWCIAWQSL